MKKALGIIMIIVGAFLSLPFLATVIQLFQHPFSTSQQRWRAIGFFLGTAVVFAIILTLITLGIRIIRAARKGQQ